MAAKNLLANQFATIYNSEIRNKKECIVVPASRLASDILRVLQKHKYVGEFEYIDDGLAGKFRIQLLGRLNKCNSISPRFSVGKNEYARWEQRYLPAVGVGMLLVSTSHGVMTHTEAIENGLGGRLLGYVY